MPTAGNGKVSGASNQVQEADMNEAAAAADTSACG
jgi:hypothetical protein